MKIFQLCCFLFVRTQVLAQRLQHLVDDLNRGLGISTNIYYGDSSIETLEEAIRYSPEHTPRLVVDKRATYEVRRHFDDAMLTVVVFERKPESEYFPSDLGTILKRRHQSHIVFVMLKKGDGRISVVSWQLLAQWCWREGYYNVLFTDGDVASTLLTYMPFPEVRLQQISVVEYVAGRRRWHDLHGYPIRVVTGHMPPVALTYHNRHGQRLHGGVVPSLMELLVRQYNASLHRIKLHNQTVHSYWFACVLVLRERRADICGYRAPLSGSRDEYTITTPLYLSDTYLMVPYAQPLQKRDYPLLPLRPQIGLLLLVLFSSGLMLALVCRVQCAEWRLGHCLLEALRALLFVGFRLPLRDGWPSILLHFSLAVSGFMLTNLYVGQLSSILSVNVYQQQINEFADLRRNNISVYYDLNYRKHYEDMPIPQVVWQQMVHAEVDKLTRWRNELNGSHAYIATGEESAFYLYQQKFLLRPRMKLLDEVLYSELPGLPLADNWPLEELLNAHLRYFFESGIHDRIKVETRQEAISRGIIRFFPTEHWQVLPLSVEYCLLLLLLLALGYAAGSVCLLAEWVVHSRFWTKLKRT